MWGVKWNIACPLVSRGFESEGWNEVCWSVLVWSPYEGEINVPLSYLDPNIRGKMKHSLSVCHTWILLWWMKCNVCTSVRLETRYEGVEWNVVCPSVCLTWISKWGVTWNVVFFRRSILRGFQYERVNKVHPSSLLWSKYENETKRSLSVCLSKTTICPSVLRRYKYVGWNETLFVRMFS